MTLKQLEEQLNYLYQIDSEFLNLSNEFIIDNGLEELEKFMTKRNNVINSIQFTLTSITHINDCFLDEVTSKIKENTELLTLKCTSIQKELKNRMIKTNNFKSAHLYFHNTQPISIFVDKTV